MKSFLRENPTITFGLGLPLLLVVVFLFVSAVPSFLVAPAKYDVLYTTGYYNRQSGLQINVVEQKVRVSYRANVRGSGYGNVTQRLWRYNPQTGAVQEIAIILPPESSPDEGQSTATAQAPKTIDINVPDIAGLTIDSSSIAPDGYEFDAGRNRHSGNIFRGLFYSQRYGYEAVLKKNGRSISLPKINGRYYSRDIQFVGWVVPQ